MQFPGIWAAWCGVSLLCASESLLLGIRSCQGFSSQPYLHCSVSCSLLSDWLWKVILPAFSVSCPLVSWCVSGTRWTCDLPALLPDPHIFYLILHLLSIPGWETRAQGPNPVCHLSLLMKFSWNTATSLCLHFVWLYDGRVGGDRNRVPHKTKIFTFGPFMKKVCKPLVFIEELPPLMVKILPFITKKLWLLCIIPL